MERVSAAHLGRNGFVACMELQFTEDIFGPVRALSLFAALGVLPEEFHLQKSFGARVWNVTISVSAGERIQRVLSKIETLPGLISICRDGKPAEGAQDAKEMERSNV